MVLMFSVAPVKTLIYCCVSQAFPSVVLNCLFGGDTFWFIQIALATWLLGLRVILAVGTMVIFFRLMWLEFFIIFLSIFLIAERGRNYWNNQKWCILDNDHYTRVLKQNIKFDILFPAMIWMKHRFFIVCLHVDIIPWVDALCGERNWKKYVLILMPKCLLYQVLHLSLQFSCILFLAELKCIWQNSVLPELMIDDVHISQPLEVIAFHFVGLL